MKRDPSFPGGYEIAAMCCEHNDDEDGGDRETMSLLHLLWLSRGYQEDSMVSLD